VTDSLGNSRALGVLYAVKIKIHASNYSPRLRYVADFLLGQILGFSLLYENEEEEEDSKNVFTIHYGTKRSSTANYFIPAHSFLTQVGLEPPEIIIQEEDGLPAFFHLPTIENADLPFDIFAMSFYLLSRFEEYDEVVAKDEHQRFPASASLAHRKDFLLQPLVDQWAWRLYNLLSAKFPNCPERKPNYTFLPTIDVDFAWAYLHKGWGRTLASFFKSIVTLNRTALTRQLRVILAKHKDPYDTFDFLLDLYEKHNVKGLFFFLLGNYGAFDKNNPPEQKSMQVLMKRLAKKAKVGIHPSYTSNNSFSAFENEKKILEKAIEKPVKLSRQHFLKLHLPMTYRSLLAAGIEEDYSMGYAASIGYRASTAYPFFWYDLEEEKATRLKVIPFAVMDVTLKNYLQWSTEEALTACAKMIVQTRHTGGVFCLLWHNSSFSAEMGFEDWGGVYEKIVALAAE